MSYQENNLRKILILDDDEVSSLALGKRLERRGFEVTLLHRPQELLSLLASREIELLVLDIVMPEMDGLSVLKMVREKYSKNELVIIMVTSVDDSFDVVEAFKLGANDYINKPVNVDVATARFNAHLSAKELALESTRKSEIEAINALIITYHHEINNPLMIACASLEMLEKNSADLDKNSFFKIADALKRITLIVKAIRAITDNEEVIFEKYVGDRKMIRLKK